MAHSKDPGIVRDEKGQKQPKDETRTTAGVQEQKDAAKHPVSPGQPAGGEKYAYGTHLDRSKTAPLLTLRNGLKSLGRM